MTGNEGKLRVLHEGVLKQGREEAWQALFRD
jgi:hypothetical protein